MREFFFLLSVTRTTRAEFYESTPTGIFSFFLLSEFSSPLAEKENIFQRSRVSPGEFLRSRKNVRAEVTRLMDPTKNTAHSGNIANGISTIGSYSINQTRLYFFISLA